MTDLEAPPAEFATASTRIIVARHAERADDVDVGWTAHDDGFPDDPPLTPFGLEQAALLAQTLLKARPNLAVICTSPFLRCVQTADAVARAFGLPIRLEHDRKGWGPSGSLEQALGLHPLQPQGRPLSGPSTREQQGSTGRLAEPGCEHR